MTALSKRRITSARHSPSTRALTRRSEQDSADVARATDVHIRSVVDEFQNFTTLAVTNMLSELRKYRVGFTIAHQYLHQLEADIRHAVLGNVGSIISFRLGAEDTPYFVREFVDRFEVIDLIQLPTTASTSSS